MGEPLKITRVPRNGAGKWTRTTDLLITNQLLYQLSYSGDTHSAAQDTDFPK
jgi:hypothetical protein